MLCEISDAVVLRGEKTTKNNISQSLTPQQTFVHLFHHANRKISHIGACATRATVHRPEEHMAPLALMIFNVSQISYNL